MLYHGFQPRLTVAGGDLILIFFGTRCDLGTPAFIPQNRGWKPRALSDRDDGVCVFTYSVGVSYYSFS